MTTRVSSVGYVEIKTLPHFGEYAVPYKGRRINKDGEVEREFILLNCWHGETRVWLTRKDI